MDESDPNRGEQVLGPSVKGSTVGKQPSEALRELPT
jgi:hypothetical protein